MSKKNRGFIGNKTASEPCREPKKQIKERLKQAKKDLETLSDILYRVEMDYAARNQAIGSQYMEVRRLKEQLRNY